MVEVSIDSKTCDFELLEPISLSYNSADLVDLESGRTGVTLEFKMGLTPTNCEIFGIGGDVHPLEKFNSEWHSMTVAADGVTLLDGTAYLMEVVWEAGERYVVVECRGGVIAWAGGAATSLFKNIDISFSEYLTEAMIKASWTSDSAVKFFPIVRDSYEAEGSSTDVTGVRLVRTIDDYHPFFNVKALCEAIFDTYGYTIESETFESEGFANLYMSGNYSSADSSSTAQEAMGFYVKRSDDSATTTDSLGRVSMSPYDIFHTVGNLASIETIDSDYECYNHGGCLQIDGQALIFKPTTQISVGFEYYLHYKCLCSIESRSKLKGIDSLNTISDGYINWEIDNRYTDQRDSPQMGVTYKVTIFDYQDGESYRLSAYDESGAKVVIASGVTDMMTSVVMTDVFTSLLLERLDGSTYVSYEGDWALYFGYVEQTCLTEVKATVRSAPHTYSPTSPMEFEFQLLEGADPGVDFTLYSDSSIRPYFAAYPSYNSLITFEDIAQHSVSALDFLSALQHLFNLRFWTNEAAKRVTIESFDCFYSGSQWDWSEKIVEGEAIEFVDVAHSAHRSNTYGYQQTDGVVNRLGESDNIYFGEWSFEIDSYAASSGSSTELNPLFCASTNDEDGVLVVGDRDDVTMVDSLNFSPRIARYFRLQDVEGENYQLPYVAFHSPEDGFTLCFEDRDGAAGLNRLMLSEVALTQRAQVISLSLQLSVFDYTNLFNDNGQSASLRSIFCFTIGGESFKTTLSAVESYNPVSGVAKCSFLTID
ncbi:MAG: hypothetical protein SNH94_04430 [Rikenellaceae bacterium]